MVLRDMLLVFFLLGSPVLFSQTACAWHGTQSGLNLFVDALQVFDDGNGPALFVGGTFNQAGNMFAPRIARWNETSWMPVGGGMPGNITAVSALAVFDDGFGSKLYVGGGFSFVGGTQFTGGLPAHNLAAWDGTSWSVAGLAMLPLVIGGGVSAMEVFDYGTGPSLYAAGFFITAGGVPATNIARFDGNTWAPLGSGIPLTGQFSGIYALRGFDDGNGNALYVGGHFSLAGGIPVNNLARWDGFSWTPVAGGVSGSPNSRVRALTTFDDGSGPALYVGGFFTSAGGLPVNSIAKWDGTSWSALGSGVAASSGATGGVRSLCVFDDGNGPALYATGSFATAGGVLANGIARFDGNSWSALGTGILPQGSGRVLAVYDGGMGPSLYVDGDIVAMGSVPAFGLARWSCGSSISLSLTQPGGAGAPLHINNANLTPGHEYFNLVSLDLCPAGPGTGPLMGLCAQTLAGVQLLLSELAQPLDSSLFHFTATTSYLNWGPILVPPLTLDALSIDVTGGLVGPSSPVVRLTIQ